MKIGKNLESRVNNSVGTILIVLVLITGAILYSSEKKRYISNLERERMLVEATIEWYGPSIGKMFSSGQNDEIRRILRKITADEKIVGACLWDSDRRLLAKEFQDADLDFSESLFPMEFWSGREQKGFFRNDRFAILVKPIVGESDDSVRIGAVYSVEQVQKDFSSSITVLFSVLAAAAMLLIYSSRIVLERTVVEPIRKLFEIMRMYGGRDVSVERGGKAGYDAEDAVRRVKFLCEENARMKRELSQLKIALEKKVQERTRRFDEANRAKTDFLAKMSHELKAPLNAILGFTNIISKKKDLPDEVLEQLSIVRQSGEYLLLLINEVLDLSKIEAGQMLLNRGPMDLHRLLWELESIFRIKTDNKNLELVFIIDENLPRYIMADEVKLRQILSNIIDNAVKFTVKGEVRLRARVAPPVGESVSDEPWSALLFEVADTGVGILPDEKKELFKAFVQTRSGKRSRQGTGLGLAISYQLVKMMKGKIEVESTPGEGSKFSFTIPLSTTSLEEPDQSDSPIF